ncbi:hypothetical protein ACFOVU_17460 [Nocardiopsis sediminis]|uniref:DUF2157 domain-containing protein n=1 Tax=Nocardiopsis sediminis TaxID=1778267 RepID=A0ABV8FT12_9ACTN
MTDGGARRPTPTPPPRGGGPDGARDGALRGLVERGVLSAEQAAVVREALIAAEPRRAGVRWAEVVGYLGGGLVLAGVFALVATAWTDLDRPAQVVLLSLIAVVAAAAGVVMAGGPRALWGRAESPARSAGAPPEPPPAQPPGEPPAARRPGEPSLAAPVGQPVPALPPAPRSVRLARGHRVTAVRRRIAGMLFSLTAAATALAVGVGIEPDSPMVPGAAGLAVAALAYAVLPSAVGLVAAWVLSWLAVSGFVSEVLHPGDSDTGVVLGLFLVALGVVWAVLAGVGVLDHRRLGLGLAAGVALAGAQFPLSWGGQPQWAYVLTLLLAAACLAYYRWERAGVLLVFGIVGVTVAVPEMVWDLTNGAIAVSAVLLLAGAVLLAASWIGVRMHRGGTGADTSGPEAAGPGAGRS